MELPDEAIAYNYQALLTPTGEEWNAVAELRARHFVSPGRLKELIPRLTQCRSQVAAEREMRSVPPELQPLDAAFLDLPQATLDNHRRKGDASDLGRVLNLATHLREQVDRVVFLAIGGDSLGPRALFEALCSRYHN
jgi:glucose-6-phosphate isomerase